jgi:hypothetical protein
MSTIITRNSATSGSVPSSLIQGELAINVKDGRLFYGSGSGNIVREFTGSGGGGGGTTFPYTGSAIISGSLTITGSLRVTGGITGSLLGTASYATNALSASYAPSTPAFPYTGSALITGSLGITGSLSNGSGNIIKGIFSHAEGVNTTSSGSYSHAEGGSTTAIGSSAHAEGNSTTANGQFSHAEGASTTSTGEASHAEGQGTTSTGQASHAEGQNTTATGYASHAEGNGATSTGYASHAEGASTTAIGAYSHAEGDSTIATGIASHAEGLSTISSGSYSHAEGRTTTSTGQASHAEGYFTTATGNYSHAEGTSTNSTGQASHAEGYFTTASGNYSHAEGYETIAQGFASHAEGASTTANGQNSHAEGTSTIAIGQGSHAEGYFTTSTGDYSHAEGNGTTSIGQSSHAEGNSTTSTGQYSHAEGINTISSGSNSHAEGQSTTATGNASHAEGSGTNSTGNASHAEGQNTTATGGASHAEGNGTISSGDYSHAEGNDSTSIGQSSHAEGASNLTYGNYSHAEGYTTTTGQLGYHAGTEITSGVFELEQGYGNLTSSFSPGVFVLIDDDSGQINGTPNIFKLEVSSSTYNATPATQITLVDTSINTSNGKYSVGIYGTPNPPLADVSIGDFSHTSGESTHTVGRGSSTEGTYTEALGYYSHAEGSSTISSGVFSHAEGYGATAIGEASHAEGYGTAATGNYSHAEGYGTVASGSYQHVQGQFNLSSSAQSAFILGNGTADNARSNLIFASGSQVQITGSLIVSGSSTFTNIGPAIFSGSVVSTAGFTGSLQGTASYATNALSASYAPSTPAFPFTGSAGITGSLTVVGKTQSTQIGAGTSPSGSVPLDVKAQGALSTDLAFRIRNSADTKNIFKIQGDANAALGELTDSGTKTLSVNTYNNPRFVLGTGYSTDTGVISITRRQGGVLTDNTLLLSHNSFADGNQVPYKHQYVNPSSYYGSNIPAYGYNAGFMYFKDSATIANLQMKLSPDNALSIYTSSASPIETIITGSAFQLWASGSAGNAKPFIKTQNGTILYLGDQSLLYNVTASSITSSFTGSLLGTASYATNALSASYAPSTPAFPYTGSAGITGSLTVVGPTTSTQIGAGAAPSGSIPLDVRAQGALSTDLAFRVRNSANTLDRLSVTGTALSITTAVRAEMSVTANAINFGLDNHSVIFTHFSPSPVLQTQRSAQLAYSHWATLGAADVESLVSGSTIFGSTIRGGVLTNVQNKMHFVCDGTKWGLAGTYSAGFQWFKGSQSGDAGFTTSTLPSITTANRQMWLTPDNSLILFNTTGLAYTGSTNSFQLYSTASTAGNAKPYFRTENGTVVWLGDESRLFNVTASRTIISSSQNTISGSSLTVYGSGSAQPVFTVQGSQGELFSITDSLSGSLFSVNDISGLPIMEVFSDNTTLMGSYLAPSLNTTAKVVQTNSGSFTMYSLPTASYDTAFFEYSVRSGSNARAGTIMAIQSGSAVNFTETTTTDFGSTSAVSFTVIVTGSNIALTGSSTSGAWTIKTIVRSI